MKKYFNIKNTSINDLYFINPKLLVVFSKLCDFCHTNKIQLEITSIIRTIDTYSVSTTHQDGRAMDVAISCMTKQQIVDVLNFLNQYDDMNKVGAITKSGARRLAYKHDSGQGDHIHIQVSP